MTALVSEMIALLVSGITQFATGLGQGLQSLVTAIFVTGSGTTESPYALSIFGGLVIGFGAIGLCVGLSRWVMNFVTSLGARS